MLLRSADFKHSLGVPEAGLGTTGPPACPKLDHHRPAAGTARLARQVERPTHHPPPAPALAVVSASSCGISLPSLTWELNPVKLSGRQCRRCRLAPVRLYQSPRLWPPQPPAAPTYYLASRVAVASANLTSGKFKGAQAMQWTTAPHQFQVVRATVPPMPAPIWIGSIIR